MATIRETVEKIKRVGTNNVRVVPGNAPGKSSIEINQDGTWTVVLENINTGSVDDIIRQATNRVIIG